MRNMCLGASRSRSDLSMIWPMLVAWPISTVMRHFLGMETQIVFGGMSHLACTPLISLSWSWSVLFWLLLMLVWDEVVVGGEVDEVVDVSEDDWIRPLALLLVLARVLVLLVLDEDCISFFSSVIV